MSLVLSPSSFYKPVSLSAALPLAVLLRFETVHRVHHGASQTTKRSSVPVVWPVISQQPGVEMSTPTIMNDPISLREPLVAPDVVMGGAGVSNRLPVTVRSGIGSVLPV